MFPPRKGIHHRASQLPRWSPGQDPFHLDNVAERSETLKQLFVRPPGVEVDCDVPGRKPLVQVVQPLQQIVNARVNRLRLIGAFDRDAGNPVPRSLLDRLDDKTCVGIGSNNVAQREVISEERDTADLEKVSIQSLGPELLEVVGAFDIVQRGAQHEARGRTSDRIWMSGDLSHQGASPYVAFHQSSIRDGQNDGGHSPT